MFDVDSCTVMSVCSLTFIFLILHHFYQNSLKNTFGSESLLIYRKQAWATSDTDTDTDPHRLILFPMWPASKKELPTPDIKYTFGHP